MSETLIVENLEIGGIFYPNFVIDLAKKKKGGNEGENDKQTWLPLFMLSWHTRINAVYIQLQHQNIHIHIYSSAQKWIYLYKREPRAVFTWIQRNSRCCCNETPSTAGWNQDYFTRASPQSCFQKICHAINALDT